MKFAVLSISAALLVFSGCGIHKKTVQIRNSSFEMRLVDETRKSGKEFPVIRFAETLSLEENILINGNDLENVDVSSDSFGRPAVEIQLTAEGSKKFAGVTSKNTGRRLAIVVKGSVLSAPVIREKISGGKLLIAGSFSAQEAEDIMRSIIGK